MGYSTMNIDVSDALTRSKTWKVTEASTAELLDNNIDNWRKKKYISEAEKVDGKDKIIFHFKNGQFALVERDTKEPIRD